MKDLTETLIFRREWYEATEGLPNNIRLAIIESLFNAAFYGATVDIPFINALITPWLKRIRKDREAYAQKMNSDRNDDSYYTPYTEIKQLPY